MLFMVATIVILAVFTRARPRWFSFVLMALPIPVLMAGFTTTGNPSQWEWVNFISPIFCVLLLIDGILLSPSKKSIHQHIEIQRYTPEKLSIGRAEEVSIQIINKSNHKHTGLIWENPPQNMLSPLSSPLMAEPFTLMPQESTRLTFKITPDHRGVFHFGQIDLHLKSKLGLLWKTCKLGRESRVQVYPDLKRIDEMRVRYTKSVTAGEVQRRKLGIEGLRFNSLKQYSEGDDIKKIDWRATARLGIPVTRTYALEAEQPVYLLWDAGRKMQALRKRTDQTRGHQVFLSQFDWALNTGLAFASVALSRGDTLGGCVFHQKIIQEITPKKGKLHFLQMIDMLTKIQPQAVEPDYELAFHTVAKRLKQRSLIILFTDLADPIAGQSLVKNLKLLSAKHQLIIINLGNNELTDLSDQYPYSSLDAYEKGVAHQFHRQHQHMIASLKKQQHAVVIDTSPQKLDEALIESYLMRKTSMARV